MKRDSRTRTNNNSLSRKLFASAILLCTVFLVVQTLISYQLFYHTVGEGFAAWDDHVLGVAKSSVETGLADMKRYVLQMAGSDRIRELLEQRALLEGRSYDMRELNDSIGLLLNVLVAGYDGIANVSIRDSGQWLRSDAASALPGSPGETADAAAVSAVPPPGEVGMLLIRFDGRLRPVFVATIQTIGDDDPLLVVTAKDSWIGDLLGNSSGMIIYDRILDYPLFYSEFAEECHGPIESAEIDLGESSSANLHGYRVTTTTESAEHWIFGIYTDVRKSSRLLNLIIIIGSLCMLLCLVIALVTSRVLVRRILNPINRLVRLLDRYLDRGELRPVDMTRRKHRFGEMLMVYFFSACVVPLLVSVLIYFGIVNIVLEEATRESASQYAEQSASNLDALVETIELSALRISIDRDIQQTIARSTGDSGLDIGQINRVLHAAELSGSVRQKRVHMTIYDHEGASVLSSLGETEMMDPAVLEYYQSRNYPFSRIAFEEDRIRVYRRIVSLLSESMHSVLGFLCVELQLSEFYNLFVGVESGNIQTYIFYGTENTAFLGGVPGITDALLVDFARLAVEEPRSAEDAQYFYTSVRAGIQNWVLLFRVDKRETHATARRLIATSTIMVLLMLCIVFWISYELSQRYSRSMEALQYNLLTRAKEESDVDLTAGVEISEIHRIASSLNAMVARIRQLDSDRYEAKFHELRMEADYRRAEQLALQAQINPHFLYNTLESMKFMVRARRTDAAVDMIDILGDLFRAAADDRTGLIDMATEVAYASEYIRLQKLRYEDSLDVKFEINEDVTAVMVPKLILQPILENAISHGRSGDKEIQTITISARREVELACISVENSGNYIEEQRLRELQKRIDACESHDGLGLVNANRRVRLYFGEAFGLSLENTEHGGLIVSIRIPATKEKT